MAYLKVTPVADIGYKYSYFSFVQVVWIFSALQINVIFTLWPHMTKFYYVSQKLVLIYQFALD